MRPSAVVLHSALGVVLFLPASFTAAQEPAPLHGRHAISLNIGAVDVTAGVSTSAVEGTRVSSDIALGAFLGYRYWYSPDWAFQVDAGALEVESDISTSSQGARITASTVSGVLVGVRFQPTGLAMGESGRPFLELTPGVVTGNTAEIRSFPAIVSSATQSVPAFRTGIGVDWVLGRRFAMGVVGHYLWTGDFDEPVSGYDSMRSFDVGLSLSLLLGQGR